MAANKGWIKLYRDITEHWIFRDPLLLKIWIDILIMANHEPSKVPVKNQLIEIHQGQFWTSIRKLADRWEIDKTTVARKLKLLQSDSMIYVDSQAGHGTLITVRNYGIYQGFSSGMSDRESDNESDRESDNTSDNTQTENRTENRHKQEVKNIRMTKNEKKKTNGLPPDHPDYFEEV